MDKFVYIIEYEFIFIHTELEQHREVCFTECELSQKLTHIIKTCGYEKNFKINIYTILYGDGHNYNEIYAHEYGFANFTEFVNKYKK